MRVSVRPFGERADRDRDQAGQRADPPLYRARVRQRFQALPRTGGQILPAGTGLDHARTHARQCHAGTPHLVHVDLRDYMITWRVRAHNCAIPPHNRACRTNPHKSGTRRSPGRSLAQLRLLMQEHEPERTTSANWPLAVSRLQEDAVSRPPAGRSNVQLCSSRAWNA